MNRDYFKALILAGLQFLVALAKIVFAKPTQKEREETLDD